MSVNNAMTLISHAYIVGSLVSFVMCDLWL